MEPGPIRVRLSLMMFGQYLILGAWAVPLATYLLSKPDHGGLGFSPAQTSWIYSTTALASLVAPLLLGLLADRLFAAQKLLAFFHLAGAGLFYAAARFCSGTQAESADRVRRRRDRVRVRHPHGLHAGDLICHHHDACRCAT